MRNFKETLRFSIEQALDDGFAKHIPLTSDYLAGELKPVVEKMLKEGMEFDTSIETLNLCEQNADAVVSAHWEICCDGYYPYCSRCKQEPQGREMTKYCPNCGAKMG